MKQPSETFCLISLIKLSKFRHEAGDSWPRRRKGSLQVKASYVSIYPIDRALSRVPTQIWQETRFRLYLVWKLFNTFSTNIIFVMECFEALWKRM